MLATIIRNRQHHGQLTNKLVNLHNLQKSKTHAFRSAATTILRSYKLCFSEKSFPIQLHATMLLLHLQNLHHNTTEKYKEHIRRGPSISWRDDVSLSPFNVHAWTNLLIVKCSQSSIDIRVYDINIISKSYQKDSETTTIAQHVGYNTDIKR